MNLTPLCYLWKRDQKEILQEMVDFGLDSILVKTASIGLESKHLGLNLKAMLPELFHLVFNGVVILFSMRNMKLILAVKVGNSKA